MESQVGLPGIPGSKASYLTPCALPAGAWEASGGALRERGLRLGVPGEATDTDVAQGCAGWQGGQGPRAGAAFTDRGQHRAEGAEGLGVRLGSQMTLPLSPCLSLGL